jgi:deoxyadenosine/deoxycytidine kinase
MRNKYRKDVFVVAVEGIIGAGKTTLTKRLRDELHLHEVPEPVEDNPFLENFYKDQKKWAFPMQMWMVQRRAESIADAVESHKNIITDRSLVGDMVFAKMHKDNGNIDAEMWPVYRDTWSMMNRLLAPVPDVIVFLDVNPSTAFKRMHNRGRQSEVDGVTLSYLQDLCATYRSTIEKLGSNFNGTESFRHTRIECLKGDTDHAVIVDIVKRHMANKTAAFSNAAAANEYNNDNEVKL